MTSEGKLVVGPYGIKCFLRCGRIACLLAWVLARA